ncbi:uncharacterized protein LOC122380962 [Amphibalanus amphitrite]|uniref:uncharacterized protein LOC122380962 n=1 Tax=Amphibalanus amphitrite TaxID=1232801 RepID=UPI001C9041D0|nr:uncharacterized protein LOC122380962 [Amphibalanus amphitrite]
MPGCAVPECRHGTGKTSRRVAGVKLHTPYTPRQAAAWWHHIRSGGQSGADGTAAAAAADGDSDDSIQRRRKKSREERQKRQERKERRELVEKLLSEHEEKQRARPPVQVIELEQRGSAIRRPPKVAGGDDPASVDDAPDEWDGGDGAASDGADSDDAGGPIVNAYRPARRPIVNASRPAPALTAAVSRSLQRTKEIVRLNVRLRKLESRCIRVLAVPGAPRPGGAPPAAAAAGQPGAPRPGGGPPAAAAADQPLVVLRDTSAAAAKKLPLFVTQLLHRNELPDSLASFTPTSLEAAQEANHRLKVQYLQLQATMLRWAIQNKKARDAAAAAQRDSESRRRRRTVGGARLRQLLRLETAVKAMFTEAQLRAIVHEHGGSDKQKRKFKPHWGEEDLRRALELRAVAGSDRVVEHVREKMKIPLPGTQTIRKRCMQSPELTSVYREMVQKGQESRRRCADCRRQLATIDGVIGADRERPPSGADSDSDGEQPPRRAIEAAVAAEAAAAAARGWPDTSDSDAELSDPGVWSRIERAMMGAGGRPPDAYDTDDRAAVRRAWR